MGELSGSRAIGLTGVGAPNLMAERRRRPVRSPVSLSQLATRAWRSASPFMPLLLLGLVFGLSLGVVHVVEKATPLASPPIAVSSPPPPSGP
jgi:hypothetical protein